MCAYAYVGGRLYCPSSGGGFSSGLLRSLPHRNPHAPLWPATVPHARSRPAASFHVVGVSDASPD